MYVLIGETSVHDTLNETRAELRLGHIAALRALRSKASDLSGLAAILGTTDIDAEAVLCDLIHSGFVVPDSRDESFSYTVRRINIETCDHCNARCRFCPQSLEPKPRHVMPQDTFEAVVRATAPYRPISVSLNNFSEPFIDPLFVERCRTLQTYGLKLQLNTNGTVLKQAVVEYLASSNVIHGILVNFPSSEPEEWSWFMQLPANLHGRVIANIRTLASVYNGIVGIPVNGQRGDHDDRTAKIAEMFADYTNVHVERLDSHTVAGKMGGELVGIGTHVTVPRLGGCAAARMSAHVHFSSKGDVFMCCLDYWHEHTFGNIADASLHDIMTSSEAVRIRRELYGMTDAGPGLLCRKCCHVRLGSLD